METSLSLYKIEDDLRAILDTLEGASEEDRPQLEIMLREKLEAEVRKVDGLCQFLTHLDDQARLAAEEIKRLQLRKSHFDAHGERLKQYVIDIMQQNQLPKLEGKYNTLTLRQCPASVEIIDESAIPSSFQTVKTIVSVDKAAIKKAIQAGHSVPGADLIIGKYTLARK